MFVNSDEPRLGVMTQEEFIKQINAKQMTAFRELFREYYRYLVLYAIRFVQQPAVAEDIVQEVMTAVWESTKTYNSYYGFRSFLYDSVKHGCLNHLRHQEVEKRYCIQVLEENENNNDDYQLMKEEVYRKLYQAVNELPDRCREIFEFHLQGKKNEEIAELLNLSVLTVKTQKKKAMRYLRERLGSLYFVILYLLSTPN